MNMKNVLFIIGLVLSSYSLAMDTNSENGILGCLVEPSQKIAVSSPIPGVLEQVLVKRGESVQKGQLLFQLKAGVQAATVKLAAVKADFARRNLDRNTNLYDEEMLSEHERDEIQTESLLANKELQVAKEELAMRRIKSPATAIVIDRLNEAGEFISNEPVLELAVLNPLYIELLISADKFGQYKKGDTLNVFVPYSDKDEYHAEVTIVDPTIDPSSATFRVQAVLDNAGFDIPSGVNCQLTPL